MKTKTTAGEPAREARSASRRCLPPTFRFRFRFNLRSNMFEYVRIRSNTFEYVRIRLLCSSPHFVRVHALFESTPCSSTRFVRVHTFFKSTLIAVQAHSQFFKFRAKGPRPLILRSRLVLRPRFVRICRPNFRPDFRPDFWRGRGAPEFLRIQIERKLK